METIKQHFEAEAKEYDDIINKLIPYYSQMLNARIGSIPNDNDSKIRVLDLGCGTGTISKRISERFPNSEIVCIDIAANMVEIAKFKLQNHPIKSFQVADFTTTKFESKFDVVVSSLALHHLDDDTKKRDFYASIYSILNNEGVFYNADVVLGSSTYLQNQNMTKWIEFMKRSITEKEIFSNWIPKHFDEDKPTKLIDQLEWLKKIGFWDVDVIWKYYNFAVYGGKRLT